MPATAIVPVAQALYLCDGHLGYPGGKTDLLGLFNRIHVASYPHVQRQFVVFARLLQGLGRVSFYETNTIQLHHLWVDLRHCVFDVPGDQPPHLPAPKRLKKRQIKKTPIK